MDKLNSHQLYHYKDFDMLNEEDDDDLDARKKSSRRKRRMLTGVSKQRRAANERERKRLQIINKAYKELKGTLPLFPNEDNIPKIKIVQLATRTIKYLSDILNNDEFMNDYDPMHYTRNREYSDMSASSPDSCSTSSNCDELATCIKLEPVDTDVSNMLFDSDDIKLELDSMLPTLDIDDSSLSSADGFGGLDLSFFINS